MSIKKVLASFYVYVTVIVTIQTIFLCVWIGGLIVGLNIQVKVTYLLRLNKDHRYES